MEVATGNHSFQAVIGEHSLSVSTETQLRIERSIVSMVRHPDYNDNTLKNDIALFKMNEAVSKRKR